MLTVALLLALLLLAAPAGAANFSVFAPEDAPDLAPGDGQCDTDPSPSVIRCTLRAALETANLTPGPDLIELHRQTYTLGVSGSLEDAAASGDLDVTDVTGGVEIRGVLGGGSAIDVKGAKDRAFDVHPGASLALIELTLLNAKTAKDDPGGGCVRSAGELELDRVLLHRCASGGDGGCVSLTGGSAELVDTTLNGCKARGAGGGLEVEAPASAELERVTVNACKAASGGGIATSGALTLRNATIDGNKAKGGGGVDVLGDAPVTINSSTLASNGGTNLATGAGALVTVSNTIVWSSKGSDCAGSVASAGGNLEGGTSCGFTGANDQRDADPELLPLGFYGGRVATRALPVTSPALDHGLDASCEEEDARGRPRRDLPQVPGSEDCDSGAFEHP